jgi:uncharacterized protein
MSSISPTGSAARPLPDIRSPLSAPYWQAARERRLDFQHCVSCGYVLCPAARRCPECLATELEWRTVSPEGSLWSWAVYEHPLHPAFTQEVPYILIAVELDAGPFLYSNLNVGAENDLRIGARLRAAFVDISPDVTLVKFDLL